MFAFNPGYMLDTSPSGHVV